MLCPMQFCVFRNARAGSVAACERHNERKKEAYKSNPDIALERSKYNYHLIQPPRYTYKKERLTAWYRRRAARCGVTV